MANIFTNGINNTLKSIRNIFYVPTNDLMGRGLRTGNTFNRTMGGSADPEKNIANTLAPIIIPRLKQDISNWRTSITEAERPILPFRYLQQQMYLDTALDPHICACVERRKSLTLLRKFEFHNEDGSINEEWTNYFDNKDWFDRFISYSLDSIFYGYSLISMGDIVNNNFINVNLIRRGNVSPDRLNVAPVPYDPAGVNFTEEPYSDFHIWISTPNEHGVSNCGYGLFYVLTPLAIFAKNNLTYNAQYNELFGMPLRQLKSDKKDEEERLTLQQAMENMGAKGWIITNTDDELILHNAHAGQGFGAYSDLEHRLQKQISKIILGHADALDSTPGKLGSGQADEFTDKSPQDHAFEDVRVKDGDFIMNIVNEKLLPLMRKNGINVPENLVFTWSTDEEDMYLQKFTNEQNIKISEFIYNMTYAGYEMTQETIKKLTNIDFEPFTGNIRDKQNTAGGVPENKKEKKQ
jgi:hypothetical protein